MLAQRLSVITVRTILVSTVTMLAFCLPAQAQAPETANLIGGWRMTLNPGTTDESYAVLLVNEGGTANVRVIDGDRAEGVWKKISRGNFALTFDEFDDVDGDGERERYRSRVTIQLSDRNNLTGTLTIDEMSLDGSTVLEFEGTGSFQATRMLVELE